MDAQVKHDLRERISAATNIEELMGLKKPCLLEMADCLCKLITMEIDGQGKKKRVRGWLKSLHEVREDIIEMGAASIEEVSMIQSVEREAEEFLFRTKF
jgi:hypothetical protein